MKKLLLALLLASSLHAEEKLFMLRAGFSETTEISETINKLLANGWEVKSVTPSSINNSSPQWVVVLKK